MSWSLEEGERRGRNTGAWALARECTKGEEERRRVGRPGGTSRERLGSGGGARSLASNPHTQISRLIGDTKFDRRTQAAVLWSVAVLQADATPSLRSYYGSSLRPVAIATPFIPLDPLLRRRRPLPQLSSRRRRQVAVALCTRCRRAPDDRRSRARCRSGVRVAEGNRRGDDV